MTRPDDPARGDERAALYLAGAMTPAEEIAFETELADGDAQSVRAVNDFAPAVRALLDCPPVAPPPGLRAAVLAQLPPPNPRASDRVPAKRSKGIRYRFADDADFRPTGSPGVSVRLLHMDAANRRFTCLVRMAPGSTLPGHAHDGPEECVVLDGELLTHGVRMRKGDYQRVEPGTEHADQFSETGCLLYLTGPASLLQDC
jgi:quercetin dioxygenase-like cupin family protein